MRTIKSMVVTEREHNSPNSRPDSNPRVHFETFTLGKGMNRGPKEKDVTDKGRIVGE
ncbi:hypothetical protein [Leptospira sp. GIMC2001]|uniref:hypothetical protein n=1 Tax=Leptospira sp. GIMC2001 TaxID=1513297 RepID=UPI002349D8AA|nr:hypothetical protein [Leptospira sp. GIMC2001]WCL49983.1 hypothetical protein O4O04_03960 [Leptospira sp. GIMC2001]